ncbi:hypothetical protein B566_EDAN001232, partial [Ephemera danica]
MFTGQPETSLQQQPGTERGRSNSRFHRQSDENVSHRETRISMFERLDGGYNHRQQNGNGRRAIKRIVFPKSEETEQQQSKRTRVERSQERRPHWQRQGGNFNQRQHDNRQQRGRPQGLNFRANRNNLNAEYPLKNLGLHDLLMSSNDELVLILANESNKFEDLIKSKLTLEEFKLALQMLQKVCQSEYDINKIQILNQSCNPEFLRQFNTFLLQGMAGNELSNLLNSMNDFFLTVMKLMPATACDKLKSDVCVINACIKGLSLQGNVQLDPKVLENLEGIINDLDKIQGTTSKPKLARERYREQEQLNPPPNDFREISIYPSIEDVLNNDRPYLRSNVVQGRYFDVEHYLDVQFRLLREDYVRPLREGIADYLRKGPSTRKCDAPSVRIYKDVTFIKYVKEVNSKPGTRPVEGTLLSFTPPGRRPIDWEHSKRFMHGALLCFTNNNFHSLLFATVCERDKKYLSQNQLLVQFCEPYKENIYQVKSYIMVESEVFFEPYYQVLKTLQALDETTFPMRDYIIEVKNTDTPPKYLFDQNSHDAANNLHPSKQYCLRHATQRKSFKVDVMDKSTWPSAEELGLDPSQHTALHSALTNELAVIQGPPGTGKTFMALKIAETLIKNKEAITKEDILFGYKDSTPILVVCLTNHALDQFLVGILKFTKKLIRIGGQSKCEELDQYNLRRIKNNVHNKARNKLYYKLSDSKNNYIKSLEMYQDYLACISSSGGIIPIHLLKPIIDEQNLLSITPNIRNLFYSPQHCNDFLLWLFDGQELVISRAIVDSLDFAKPYRFSKLRSLLKAYEINEYEAMKVARQNGEDESNIFWYESQIQFNVIFTANFINNLELQVGNLLPPTEEQAAKLLCQNMWKLQIHQRWQLYALWIHKFDEHCQKKICELENKILEKNKHIEELRFHDSLEVLRKSDVVGLTTTGAARLHKMLQMLKCKIGDHKQLRPNIAVYALGKFHNFDVSLFERFVRNRGQCVTLQVQHRMAPEMATLIVPTIYPVLYNDPTVLERPAVNGVPKRLFFVTHTQPEQQDTEMTSRKNEHEAQFLIALCEHLIIQGYEESKITILTTYKGQMFYMKKEIRNGNHNTIRGVHVTVVDNFQGEENDIILLSLVRSNAEGRIGFLATENRVCVALSRARQALYIVGNMELLSGASDIWKAVQASLLDIDSLGPALPLKCQVHQHQQLAVSLPEDFRKYAPEGGCTEICTVTLNCGHVCERICHLMNRDHTRIRCMNKNPCTRMCEANLHWCEKRCNQDCGKCMKLVNKQLPCGHEYNIPCWRDPQTVHCNASVEKEFEPCKHKATVKCSDTKCPHPCENRLPCGHSCKRKCHTEDDPDHLQYKCMKLCTKFNKNCKSEHPCEKLCHEECVICDKMVKRILACGHQLEMKCTTDPDTVKCKEKCKKKLFCGHWCKRDCFEPCEPCKKLLTKQIKDCKHDIKFSCGVEPQREHCKQKCERLLECGHPCTRNCAEPCRNKKCAAEVGIVTASCGHEVQLLCWEKTKGLTEPSIAERCQKPCKENLICGHTCTGNCFVCKQGRYHIPCKQVCQRKFACGHRCSGLCSNPCQVCRKDCNNYCAHQKCFQMCGVQCNPCKRMCTWSCEHYQCTRQCSFPCNRPPCDEPCKKKLKCGHLCAGLCGEICPELCWECDKQQLISGAMVQNEVSPTENPRFVISSCMVQERKNELIGTQKHSRHMDFLFDDFVVFCF